MNECVNERAGERWDQAVQALQTLTGQPVQTHDDETLSSPFEPLGDLLLSPFRAARPGFLLRVVLPLGPVTQADDERRILQALNEAMQTSGRLQLLFGRSPDDWAMASLHVRALVSLDAEPDLATLLASLQDVTHHIVDVLARLLDELFPTEATREA